MKILFLVFISICEISAQHVGNQEPAFLALDHLRGSTPKSVAAIRRLLSSAIPGKTYPTLSKIPRSSFSCDTRRGSGFFADPETGCQVYRQCIPGSPMYSYLCPNQTLFNQITLVCDWWYNINCEKSADYYSYSNPRLHQEHVFFLVDNRREPVRTASGRADESSGGTEGSEGDQNQPNGPNGTAEGSGENNQEDGEGVAGTVNIGHGIQAWPASGADANNSHRRKTTRKSTRSHGDSAASEDPETADSESTDTATYGNEEPDDTTARPVGSHGGADGSGAEGSPDFDESDSESPIPAVDEYGNPLEPESTPETELGNGGDHGRHRTTKRGNRLTTEEPGEESTSADGTEETDSEDTEDHTTSEPVEGSPEGEDDGESTISPSKISTEAVSEGAGEESDTKNDSTSPEPSEDPPVEGSTESSNGETEETYGTAEAEGVTESAGGDGSGPKETGDQSDPTKDRTEIPDRETIENSDAAGANGKLESELNGGAAGGEGGLEAAGTPGETSERPDSNLGDIDDTVPARPTRPTRRQSTQPSEAEAPKTRGGHQAVRALTGFNAAGRNRGHLAMLSPKFTTMYPTNQIQKLYSSSDLFTSTTISSQISSINIPKEPRSAITPNFTMYTLSTNQSLHSRDNLPFSNMSALALVILHDRLSNITSPSFLEPTDIQLDLLERNPDAPPPEISTVPGLHLTEGENSSSLKVASSDFPPEGPLVGNVTALHDLASDAQRDDFMAPLEPAGDEEPILAGTEEFPVKAVPGMKFTAQNSSHGTASASPLGAQNAGDIRPEVFSEGGDAAVGSANSSSSKENKASFLTTEESGSFSVTTPPKETFFNVSHSSAPTHIGKVTFFENEADSGQGLRLPNQPEPAEESLVLGTQNSSESALMEEIPAAASESVPAQWNSKGISSAVSVGMNGTLQSALNASSPLTESTGENITVHLENSTNKIIHDNIALRAHNSTNQWSHPAFVETQINLAPAKNGSLMHTFQSNGSSKADNTSMNVSEGAARELLSENVTVVPLGGSPITSSRKAPTAETIVPTTQSNALWADGRTLESLVRVSRIDTSDVEPRRGEDPLIKPSGDPNSVTRRNDSVDVDMDYADQEGEIMVATPTLTGTAQNDVISPRSLKLVRGWKLDTSLVHRRTKTGVPSEPHYREPSRPTGDTHR